MKWKIGDFGRFRMEDDKRPRFVVRGIDKVRKDVIVHYSGEVRPQRIPAKTFKEDCVNTWVLENGPLVTMPPWFHEGVIFEVGGYRESVILLDMPNRNRTRTSVSYNFSDSALQAGKTQFDHVACLETQTRVMLLLSQRFIQEHGRPIVTVWDRIMSDDDPFEDPMEDIFKDYEG